MLRSAARSGKAPPVPRPYRQPAPHRRSINSSSSPGNRSRSHSRPILPLRGETSGACMLPIEASAPQQEHCICSNGPAFEPRGP